MELILGAVGTILWSLFSIIFTVIDMIQGIFQAFAGTGTVYIDGNVVGSGNTGDLYDTGIIYYFLQSDLVVNMFFSILYLAIILLIVFTVMAVLKNMYQPTPKKWQEIIASAIKGLGLFIFVPACSLLGVWLGNILLVAIDGATQNTGYATTISRRLFISSAYTANHIRLDATGVDWQTYSKVASLCDTCGIEIRAFPGGENSGEIDPDYEYYAALVDDCFATGIPSVVANWDVSPWYNLIEINYLLLAAGGIFILYVLGAITFGMVKRLFILVILFIISPAMCAMYPIDEGNAYKSWAGEFKKNLLSAYGAVAGMNLFFSVAPMIEMISIPDIGDALGLLPLALTVAGLYVVKDIINLISGFAGGENAYSSGAGLMTSVNSRRKQVAGITNKTTRSIAGAFGKAKSRADAAREVGNSGAGAFFSSLGGSLKETGKNALSYVGEKGLGIDAIGIREDAKKGYKDNHEQDEKMARFKRMQNIMDTDSTGEKNRKYIIQPDGSVLKRGKVQRDPITGEKMRDGDGDLVYDYNPVTKGVTKVDQASLIKAAKEAGIGDYAVKRSGIAYKSMEDYDSDQEKLKDVEKKSVAYRQTAGERDDYISKINTESRMGVYATQAGLSSADEARTRILSGKTFTADELSFDSLRGNAAYAGKSDDDLRKMISSRQSINDMATELEKRRSAAQSAGSSMIDSMRGFKGDDLKAQFSDDEIEKLSESITAAVSSNNTTSKTTADAMISAMNSINDSITKTLSDTIVKQSQKLIKELKDNTEQTKPKDKK